MASLCEYSMMAWYWSGGIHRPKHFGQPGHPSPDPVARTSAPIPMRTKVAAVAESHVPRHCLRSILGHGKR